MEKLNKPDLEKALVSRIIDGDTIVLEDGRIVRLIGINAPEQNEEGFNEASEFTRKQVENKIVYLEKEGRNKATWGRLRRYVWLSNDVDVDNVKHVNKYMLNALLLRKGHAVVSIFEKTKWEEYFRSIQVKEK